MRVALGSSACFRGNHGYRSQANDAPQFEHLLAHLKVGRSRGGAPRTRPSRLRADKAYSSRAIRAELRRRGIAAVIPEPSDQIAPRKRHGSRGRSATGLRHRRLQGPQRHRTRIQQHQTMARPGHRLRQTGHRLAGGQPNCRFPTYCQMGRGCRGVHQRVVSSRLLTGLKPGTVGDRCGWGECRCARVDRI